MSGRFRGEQHFNSSEQNFKDVHLVHTQRMPTSSAAEDLLVSSVEQNASTITLVIAGVCLVWYVAVAFVCSIGTLQLYDTHTLDGANFVLMQSPDREATRGLDWLLSGAMMRRM